MTKKIIKIIVPLVAIFLLSACGSTVKQGSSTATNFANSTSGERTPAVQRAKELINRRDH